MKRPDRFPLWRLSFRDTLDLRARPGGACAPWRTTCPSLPAGVLASSTSPRTPLPYAHPGAGIFCCPTTWKASGLSAPNETPNGTPTLHPDLLLEIKVCGGDAGLLRVIATLHHRRARVRSLTYDASSQDSHLRVRIAGGGMRRGHLIGALDRCVDVLSVRPATVSETVMA